MIKYLLSGIVVLFLLVLVYGGLTGRLRRRDGCCCPADPHRDLRMGVYDRDNDTRLSR